MPWCCCNNDVRLAIISPLPPGFPNVSPQSNALPCGHQCPICQQQPQPSVAGAPSCNRSSSIRGPPVAGSTPLEAGPSYRMRPPSSAQQPHQIVDNVNVTFGSFRPRSTQMPDSAASYPSSQPQWGGPMQVSATPPQYAMPHVSVSVQTPVGFASPFAVGNAQRFQSFPSQSGGATPPLDSLTQYQQLPNRSGSPHTPSQRGPRPQYRKITHQTLEVTPVSPSAAIPEIKVTPPTPPGSASAATQPSSHVGGWFNPPSSQQQQQPRRPQQRQPPFQIYQDSSAKTPSSGYRSKSPSSRAANPPNSTRVTFTRNREMPVSVNYQCMMGQRCGGGGAPQQVVAGQRQAPRPNAVYVPSGGRASNRPVSTGETKAVRKQLISETKENEVVEHLPGGVVRKTVSTTSSTYSMGRQ